MNARCVWAALVAVLGAGADMASAQERPVRWRVQTSSTPVSATQGSHFQLRVAATIDTGWKLYSLAPQVGGPIATTISLGETAGFSIAGISAPKPESYPDRNFNIFTEIYTESVRFDVRVLTVPTARVGRHTLPVYVQFQTCTDRYCLPPRTDTLSVAVQVSEAIKPIAASSAPPPPAPTPTVAAAPPITIVAPTDMASFARFIWLAITMGLLSLLTPCILPMIPITVAYFGGSGDTSGRSRAFAALAHALGIVVVFILLGSVFAAFFGAAGILRLAANPWLNLGIAALFIAFALNLLGVFEITLPQRVLTGVARLGDDRRRTAGAILMGGAFAITSFTCTVPFVGTLLVLTTQGSWRWPLVGLAAYGAAFAFPFFLLAIAPNALQRLPRSGAWMIALKRSLAIAELALAIKFLSNADLVLGLGLLSREVVIGLWLFAALGIAVLWAASTRTSNAGARVAGAAALVAAALAAVWLARGLRGVRLGELEAYLPPQRAALFANATSDGSPRQRNGRELGWIMNDYGAALARGKAEERPVLLDFTGYTCTNCRWMEANMFPREEIAARLARFVRVRLFTDGVGEPYVAQQRLQLDRFGTVALPYYAVLDRHGTPVATFLGMTRDEREFSRFLEQALIGSPSGGSR